jgi:hypothetical protein
MKQKLLSITTILILGFLTQSLSAQNQPKTVPVPLKKQFQSRTTDSVKNEDFSLKGQYQFMLSRSKSLYGNKLINPARLNTLWQSVTDTLRKERMVLSKAQANMLEQQKTIANLQTEASGKETSLNETHAKINEINFLGISFTKGTYNIVVWSIIIVLALALFIVIARSAKNILEAKHRTQLYDEVSAEYQSYKVKANEKERKLARELQDERNVIEEMKSRGKG